MQKLNKVPAVPENPELFKVGSNNFYLFRPCPPPPPPPLPFAPPHSLKNNKKQNNKQILSLLLNCVSCGKRSFPGGPRTSNGSVTLFVVKQVSVGSDFDRGI